MLQWKVLASGWGTSMIRAESRGCVGSGGHFICQRNFANSINAHLMQSRPTGQPTAYTLVYNGPRTTKWAVKWPQTVGHANSVADPQLLFLGGTTLLVCRYGGITKSTVLRMWTCLLVPKFYEFYFPFKPVAKKNQNLIYTINNKDIN